MTNSGLATARDWYTTMPEPILVVGDELSSDLSIRHYQNSSAEMRQPALCDNLICLHQGGPKEVQRWHNGRKDVYTVELGALTIMPAKAANRWLTRGPIDFTHLMLSSSLIGRVALEEFDRDPSGAELADSVGFRDPYFETLFSKLLHAVEGRARVGRLYPESLLVVLVVALLERHSTLAAGRDLRARMISPAKGGLTPRHLRLVVDYMNENLAADISLADLTAVIGLSRAQFFRAFKESTGATPFRFLTDLRLDTASGLLGQGKLELCDIAAATGLPNSSTFNTLFRRRFGLTPKAYKTGK